jgi:osmotically-inducible protein OsmY/sporulation protein YlmC with PRC-barrel domain
MKTMQQAILVTLLPLLTTSTILAESEPTSTEVSASVERSKKVTASSWRASQVIGTNVKNNSNETVGEVEDLVVDLKTGEILAVVISSGGFLGIADTLSSVPVSSVSYDANAKAFKTTLTKEQLKDAPQFNKSSWPDYDDTSVRDKMRTYRDAIGGDVNAPDNSARNEEEANEIDPTAQGTSESDMETTRKIRAEIMKTDLSFNTKNIKIITKDGNVTLKGVVKNHDEHEAVLKIAKSHADASKVTDKLRMDEK